MSIVVFLSWLQIALVAFVWGASVLVPPINEYFALFWGIIWAFVGLTNFGEVYLGRPKGVLKGLLMLESFLLILMLAGPLIFPYVNSPALYNRPFWLVRVGGVPLFGLGFGLLVVIELMQILITNAGKAKEEGEEEDEWEDEPEDGWEEANLHPTCPACGDPVPRNSEFCPHCGFAIAEFRQKRKNKRRRS